MDRLKEYLTKKNLGPIHQVCPTEQHGVYAVQFHDHVSAKRAFTSQKNIRLRMVPPKPLKSYWYKNPAPNFVVEYETKRRLTVKKGKSSSQETVGDLLMFSWQMQKGCRVWADQLKGQRLRIVGFVGKMLTCKTTIMRHKRPEKFSVVGWISTRCNVTHEKFVERVTGNKIHEYLYD